MFFRLHRKDIRFHIEKQTAVTTPDPDRQEALPSQEHSAIVWGIHNVERGTSHTASIGMGGQASVPATPSVEEVVEAAVNAVVPPVEEAPAAEEAPPAEEPSADQDALIAELREELAAEKQKVTDLTAEIAWRKVAMGEEEAERFEYAD